MCRFVRAPSLPLAKMTQALSVLVALTLVPLSDAQEVPESAPIGVLAKRGPELCLDKWGPTAEYLTNEIPGYSFTIVPLAYDEVYATVKRGDVDFILADPSLYVAAELLCGASRIVTLENLHAGRGYTVYGGVVFCRADREGVQHLGDLKGKTFMAVAETSFGGWQMAWRELRERGLDPYRDLAQLRFGGTHDAVVYAVRDGEIDAGTVRTDTLERMAFEGEIDIREFRVIDRHSGDAVDMPLLHSTRVYPEWPLAKAAHTSHELANKVASALLRMSPETPAAMSARCAGWTIPHNYQSVHECLKALRVRPYEDYGKVTVRDVVRQYSPWLLGIAVLVALVVVFAAYLARFNRKLQEALETEQKELRERTVAEARIEHLNAVLRAMRDVNQLITKENDRDRLIQGACDSLIETRGYFSVWIVLFDESGGFSTAAQTGLGDAFGAMIERLKRGELTECARRALGQSGVVAIENPASTCADCPLAKDYGNRAGVTARLEYEAKVFGLISVSVASHLAADAEEQGLIAEVARDIASVLYRIELEETHKQAEQELRESEEKFRVIGSAAQDAVMMIDPEGNVSFWNAAAERVFGYTSEEVLGKDLHGTLAPATYSEAYLRGIAGFRKTGKGAAVGRTLELTALRKDGEEFPIEISLSAIRIRGQWHAVGIVRDITERKRAEGELRAAHAEMKMLLESVSSILIGVGPEDRITRWNAAAEQVFGIPADRVTGQPFPNCGIQWDWPRVLERVSACLAQNKPVQVDDVPFTRPDANQGMLGLTITPLSDDSGEISGFLVLGADITERKVLEAQLVQAQKLESIGQLAAGIAHEINTPTQYVGDNTRFLQDAFGDLLALQAKQNQLLEAAKAGAVAGHLVSEVETAAQEVDVAYLVDEIPKAIEQSLGGVERVTKIVQAMKEFSHPGTEEKTPTDLNRAIENTITVARNEWKYVADIVTDFDWGLPAVPCLPGEFNQVILNILVNATQTITDVVGDGTKGKGTITVRTRREGDWAEITIGDTGTGIPEEVQSRLFDPFFTTKGVGKGTGQGLAIARSVIVDKHGGTITFRTETGKGTTFIVRVPLDGS